MSNVVFPTLGFSVQPLSLLPQVFLQEPNFTHYVKENVREDMIAAIEQGALVSIHISHSFFEIKSQLDFVLENSEARYAFLAKMQGDDEVEKNLVVMGNIDATTGKFLETKLLYSYEGCDVIEPQFFCAILENADFISRYRDVCDLVSQGKAFVHITSYPLLSTEERECQTWSFFHGKSSYEVDVSIEKQTPDHLIVHFE